MASRFWTFSERRNFSNKAFIQTNTKKVMNFDLSVITGRLKIIVTLNLQQNCKNALDKIPKMFVNNICKQSTY